MTRKLVDDRLKRNAFSVCLLAPLNNSIYNAAYDIEELLNLLKKAKDDETFNQALQILTKISSHQATLAKHFAEIAQSMEIDPKEGEKIH